MKTATEQTLKNDPNVKIPAAVKAAAARSEELRRSINGENQEAESETPEGQEAADAKQAEKPTEKPAEKAAEKATENTLAKDAKPVEKSAEKPAEKPTEATEKPADGDDEQTWEARYKSLRGRYTKLNDEFRSMAERTAALERVVATMQSAPKQEDVAEKPAEKFSVQDLFTPEEIEDYGEDLLNVIGKRARAEFDPLLKKYQDKIATLESRLDGMSSVVQQDSREKLHSKLDASLPAWRDLNTNEDFLAWLALPDPFSGAIRHDMLKAAYAHGDAHRVLAFFKGFLAEEAAASPSLSETAPSGKSPKVPLEKLAAPGKAKAASAAEMPTEKPIISRADISKFYADVASGVYRGRDEEKARLESEIFKAQQEGRIR